MPRGLTFSVLRDADWLTAARATAIANVLAALLLLFACLFAASYISGMRADPTGRPIALDFDAFWAAGKLAWSARPELAYDNATIESVERAATTLPPGNLGFYYPPTFLLICLPLGLLSYSAALLAFVGLQYTLLTTCLRRILPEPGWGLPVFLWPGFVMNAFSGQNGGLSASCFAGYMLLLDRRPALAGACLGLLVCKPQLAPSVAVAALASRRWAVVAGCTAMASALFLTSWLSFGSAAWHGFLMNVPNARIDLDVLAIKWPKMQSAYAAVRLAGGGLLAAYATQAAVATAGLAALARVSWRRCGAGAEASVLALSCLLFTPYLFDYDMAIMAVPLAWLASQAEMTGWLAWEKTLAGVSFLLPLVLRVAGLGLGVTLGPVTVLALLALVLIRLHNGAAPPRPRR